MTGRQLRGGGGDMMGDMGGISEYEEQGERSWQVSMS